MLAELNTIETELGTDDLEISIPDVIAQSSESGQDDVSDRFNK
jgi:hypothetical protein